MDWIRRNWPDLLIGLALLAVIGGIIATLLNGGNFLPGNRNVNVTTPSSTAVSSGGNNSTTAETTISPDLPSGTATIAGDNGETTGTITPVDVSAPTDDVSTTVEAAADNIEATIEETVADATNPDVSTPEALTEALSVSASETAPYRISVGAFGSTENAERRAETFRSAGYPVFVAKQGDLSLVLIGPYENQTAAQQAVSQIQSSGLEASPIIYEFTPADAAAQASSSVTETASETTSAAVEETSAATEATSETTVSETPTDTPAQSTTVALPTSNTGRYLQVGAYGSVESAQPQLVKLQGLGFSVTYIEESEKIKLLVGPYEGATLETAKVQLQAQGIDHFVR